MAARDLPLVNRPGDPEWQRINREEAEHHRQTNMALSMSERLELGQRLSTQAVELLAAAHRAGLGPRRTQTS
jgi:hypothetical protein